MAGESLLQTSTDTLKELLANGKHYSVPYFQRDYSWREEHWRDLWEDLVSLRGSNDDHYLGALVLKDSGERGHREVIDGQQRLATLTILALACIEHLHRLSSSGVDVENNRQRAEIIEKSYVGQTDAVSLMARPKLTLNRRDGQFFSRNIVTRKPPAGGLAALGRSGSRLQLWKAFEFFIKHVGDLVQKLDADAQGKAIATFFDEIVANRIVFIVVRVRDQMSAYTIFETLNARGLDLTEADLLKNYILSVAAQEGLSDVDIETLLDQWDAISLRTRDAKLPEFLRHHLNSRIPFIRQRNLFRTIKNEVHDYQSVPPLLDLLEKDSVWYEALNDETHDLWNDFDGAKESVRVLNLFRVSQFTPLVLAAKDILSKQDVVKLLRYCLVISMRFNVIGQRSTHELESAFNKAALALRNASTPSLATVKASVRTIYVEDDEFRKDFALREFKTTGPNRRQLLYILIELEKHSAQGRDINDETSSSTIEHILPMKPDESWDTYFDPGQHLRMVGRLGNLTLLESKLNRRQAGNASFEDKKNAFSASQYLITKKLAEHDAWRPADIEHRQKEMAKRATGIWRIDFD